MRPAIPSRKRRALLTAAAITVINRRCYYFPRSPAPHPTPSGRTSPLLRSDRSPIQAFEDRNVPAASAAGLDLSLTTTPVLPVGGRPRPEAKCSPLTPPKPRTHRGPRGWRPHFRLRPGCSGSGGQRAAEPGFRPPPPHVVPGGLAGSEVSIALGRHLAGGVPSAWI